MQASASVFNNGLRLITIPMPCYRLLLFMESGFACTDTAPENGSDRVDADATVPLLKSHFLRISCASCVVGEPLGEYLTRPSARRCL
jgi:hypothetical protein